VLVIVVMIFLVMMIGVSFVLSVWFVRFGYCLVVVGVRYSLWMRLLVMRCVVMVLCIDCGFLVMNSLVCL